MFSFKFFLDLLFPARCAGCSREGGFLCTRCAQRVVIKRVAPHANLYAAAEYRDPLVSALVTKLKYRNAWEIHEILAGFLTRHLVLAGFAAPRDTIVTAVPLHKRRQAARGFNQSELIAERVAEALALPFANNLIVRVKNTAPQTEVAERGKRIANVRGAFAPARNGAVQGKTVLVIDDVTTTGATLKECAKALRQAGAKRVIACAVAS